jgi:hypothetical protein
MYYDHNGRLVSLPALDDEWLTLAGRDSFARFCALFSSASPHAQQTPGDSQ